MKNKTTIENIITAITIALIVTFKTTIWLTTIFYIYIDMGIPINWKFYILNLSGAIWVLTTFKIEWQSSQ